MFVGIENCFTFASWLKGKPNPNPNLKPQKKRKKLKRKRKKEKKNMEEEKNEKNENLEKELKEWENFLESLGLDEELLKIHTLVKLEKS